MLNLKLINACSIKFLQNNSDNLYLIANPIFHINRLHPVTLKKYEVLRNNLFLLIILFDLVINFIKIIANLFLSYKSNYSLKKNTNDQNLVISHLINPFFFNKKKDFYMHDIIKNFNLKRKTSIFLINCTKKNSKKIYKNNNNKILSEIFLHFEDELVILCKRIVQSFNFLKINSKLKIYKSYKINLLIFCSFYHPQYRFNLITLFQIENLIKSGRFKRVFITFEGHAIDRSIIKLVKKYNKNAKVYGYYHPPLFKNLLTCKKKFKNNLDPDFIICNSGIAYSFFKKIYHKKTLFCRRNKFRLHKFNTNEKKNLCLILSEGLEQEMQLFINFIKKFSKYYKNCKFVFQIHPNLNYKFYKKEIQKLRIKNVYCTQKKLINYKNYSYVIYRGSSAIIEIVAKYFVYPLYLRTNDHFNIDPLFQINYKNNLNINDKKYHFQDLNEFSFKKKKLLKSFQNYCSNYYNK